MVLLVWSAHSLPSLLEYMRFVYISVLLDGINVLD